MIYYETINYIGDKLNIIHPLSYIASKVNNDILYFYQAIKAEDADDFRKAMRKEIKSFRDADIFELIPLQNKPQHKSLILFVWLFKRKRNLMGELIKYKARLYAYGGKQVQGIDFWNTYAPVAQSITMRIMLILYQMKG